MHYDAYVLGTAVSRRSRLSFVLLPSSWVATSVIVTHRPSSSVVVVVIIIIVLWSLPKNLGDSWKGAWTQEDGP